MEIPSRRIARLSEFTPHLKAGGPYLYPTFELEILSRVLSRRKLPRTRLRRVRHGGAHIYTLTMSRPTTASPKPLCEHLILSFDPSSHVYSQLYPPVRLQTPCRHNLLPATQHQGPSGRLDDPILISSSLAGPVRSDANVKITPLHAAVAAYRTLPSLSSSFSAEIL